MESETIETFLQNLGLERNLESFKHQKLDLDLLKTLTEEELNGVLMEMKLPIGDRIKISTKMKEIRGDVTKYRTQAEDTRKETPLQQKPTEKADVLCADHARETSLKPEASGGRDDLHMKHGSIASVKAIVGALEQRSSKADTQPVPSNFKGARKGTSPTANRQKEIRIVLIGKTGVGKSATGNTILGEKAFQSSTSGSSVTGKCSQRSSIRFGHKFVIVDTPGIFDTTKTNDHTQGEICKCIAITSPGPHAFILVLSVSRFTEEEQKSIEHFDKYFGESMYKYVIILFTRKEDLDEENKTIFDHIRTCPAELKMLIHKCGERVIAFNNKLKGEEQQAQAKQLLDIILANVEKNGNQCYTNDMYKEAEKILKEREEEILKKNKVEHEKELRAIEDRISLKYEMKYKEDAKKLENTKHQLKELIEKQKHDENQVRQLKVEVLGYEKQVKESKGEEKEALKKTLDFLRGDLANMKKNAEEEALEIKKLKKSKEEEEKLRNDLIKKQEEEKRRMREEYEENVKQKARDQSRIEAENDGGIVKKVFNWVAEKIMFWK